MGPLVFEIEANQARRRSVRSFNSPHPLSGRPDKDRASCRVKGNKTQIKSFLNSPRVFWSSHLFSLKYAGHAPKGFIKINILWDLHNYIYEKILCSKK
jgi:hypothetical protein